MLFLWNGQTELGGDLILVKKTPGHLPWSAALFLPHVPLSWDTQKVCSLKISSKGGKNRRRHVLQREPSVHFPNCIWGHNKYWKALESKLFMVTCGMSKNIQNHGIAGLQTSAFTPTAPLLSGKNRPPKYSRVARRFPALSSG